MASTAPRPPVPDLKPKPHVQIGPGAQSPQKPPPTIPKKAPPTGWDRPKPQLPTGARPSLPTNGKPVIPMSKKPVHRSTMAGPASPGGVRPMLPTGLVVPRKNSTPTLGDPTAPHPKRKAPVPGRAIAGSGGGPPGKAAPTPPVTKKIAPRPGTPEKEAPKPVMVKQTQQKIAEELTTRERPALKKMQSKSDISDEENKIFTEEEKQSQREREKKEMLTAEKSTKQQLQEEVVQFVRKVKISFLERGVDLENYTQQVSGEDIKPHKIRLKYEEKGNKITFGPYSEKTGNINFNETIKISEIDSISTTFLFAPRKEGLSMSLILTPDHSISRLDFVSYSIEEFENTTEGLRALLGSPLRTSSLKEIKLISDWMKKAHGLDDPVEELTTGVPPDVPPEPPMDFVTPFE